MEFFRIFTESFTMEPLSRKFNDLNLKDDFAIVQRARKGVKPQLFYSFSSAVNIPEKNLAAILQLHPRTISNYRDKRKSLNPVESEHLLKLICLFTSGEEIFGSIDQFNQWLITPDWQRKEKPMDWLNTPGGVDLVQEELQKLSYGYVV